MWLCFAYHKQALTHNEFTHALRSEIHCGHIYSDALDHILMPTNCMIFGTTTAVREFVVSTLNFMKTKTTSVCTMFVLEPVLDVSAC